MTASVMGRGQTWVDHINVLVALVGSGASILGQPRRSPPTTALTARCIRRLNCPGFDAGSDDTEGSLSWDSRKYPDELRERATRMVLEALADPARAKGAIRRIADELGVHPEALRTWVKKAQIDQGTWLGTTTDEAQRIKELEKEVRKLRRANAIPKSASACLSRRSVSARPVDLPVHRDQEGGVWGLADLQGAHWRRSQDRPEHLTHATKARSPSARSLRDETLKTEIRRVHENQLLGAGGPQDARDAEPTRNCRASWRRSRGPLYRPCGPWATWACAESDAPSPRAPHAAHRESSARPTSSKGMSTRSGQISRGAPTSPAQLLAGLVNSDVSPEQVRPVLQVLSRHRGSNSRPWLRSPQPQVTHDGTDRSPVGPHTTPPQDHLNPPVPVGAIGVLKNILNQDGQLLPPDGRLRLGPVAPRVVS